MNPTTNTTTYDVITSTMMEGFEAVIKVTGLDETEKAYERFERLDQEGANALIEWAKALLMPDHNENDNNPEKK
ncbi:hypothetical protein [Flavobacterium cerinum]|uniref:Uncharacterized protein n=1 Tax=Flavobacterium cerinum TaxID=2502784 RepID=A0A3S3U4Z1_9FLAO|nr:hypothetical protein [Flavobacterium cerinum]RWX03392.1 hypothetical protein EPI11_00235 [Flavobacterium cerinum]